MSIKETEVLSLQQYLGHIEIQKSKKKSNNLFKIVRVQIANRFIYYLH